MLSESCTTEVYSKFAALKEAAPMLTHYATTLPGAWTATKNLAETLVKELKKVRIANCVRVLCKLL